jgi:hypothetical protein
MIDQNIKVWHLINNTYQVVKLTEETGEVESVLFQGSLADCEAYIRLTDAGYL